MDISRQVLDETPVGPLLLVANDHALLQLCFMTQIALADRPAIVAECSENQVIRQVRHELNEYFAGTRHRFEVPLELHGTPFQLEVWQALQQIPWGKKVSYKQLAHWIDRPNASRAVGMANNRNPIPIIIPCHRVIGSDGKLVGYRGGVIAKQKLLALEGAF
ncbi:methylated-DNA--[protein]-cysteine S-methyltransferase [Celerinatantimonas sp. YJH-8]|uniref:methylated-DNA--[protein]-cysteine S-methyltransferase n=1 Tax=Celerinatantimonas sp. YJH-8 TaxID=3228714 RepID=UPI0038BEA105